MLRRMLSTIFFFVLLVPASASADEKTGKLSLDLYLEMEQVSSPQISPDGRRIVYTRQWIDKVNDARKSTVWVMNADGSKRRFLVEGSVPRWSPDGTRIAYLAPGEPGGRQIFVRWMDAEGTVTQITRVEKTPRSHAWSPDSKSIAFTLLVPEKNSWNIQMPARPGGATWTQDPRIVERFRYRYDRLGFLEDGYQHIFTVPAAGGTPRQLTSGDYDHGPRFLRFDQPLSWTPDGREVLFSGLRADDWEYQYRESEVYAVSVVDRSIRQLTTRKGPDNAPVVSPDGRWVAYTGYDWTDQTYITWKLYTVGIDGSNPRVLTASLDRTPRGVRWAPDSRGVYFNVREEGTSNLYFASVAGEVRPITEGNHLLTVTDINPNGWAVGTASSYHKPADVIILELEHPELEQLTFVNDDVLADVQLGEVEEIWYTSADNLRIQGWIIKPPDFDPGKKYPLILTIHGGPHAMYGVGFNFGWQNHAANGYVVLYTNPRGSAGYGTDFGNAINNAYPSKDYDDLMKGVDEVMAQGYIDERNLFVYGCSGGGVLTAWVVGHTNRFAAASSNCPVTNWLSFVATTDGNLNWYWDFKKLPWEDPSEHLERSPLMYVGNVQTPTMLMTGVLDMRTPITQTEEFYQALKLRKVPTAMIRFNGEYHGTTRKPSNFLRTHLYLRYWFEKYMTTDMKQTLAASRSGP